MVDKIHEQRMLDKIRGLTDKIRWMNRKFVISSRPTRETVTAYDMEGETGKCVYRLDNKRKNSASIWSMFVSPDNRRTGVASRLIVVCRNMAVSDGADVLWLSVAETNAAARRLYEKSGFKIVEEIDERHKKGRVVYEWRSRE